ncbi:MAG: glycoside hydrolase [Bradymonadaceae bacterium]|nr:glycoside hydrolase [Lujinxingiaceae bacterium]
MTSNKRLVHFLWHLHQPYYSVPDRPSNVLPWVRLHAVKAYYDMGRMLERFPNVHCVINFSGSLLKQIHEYVDEGKRDLWWDLTLKPAASLSAHDKSQLLRHFFSVNWETCIRPLPRFWELLERRGPTPDGADINAFDAQDWRDLQVLFNVAWFGFSAREDFEVLRALIAKGRGFSEQDKEEVLNLQIQVMRLLLPMYRKLHQSEQIEISLTPMYHPILPLVIDTDVAARATPERPRPPRYAAPTDAHFHVEAALRLARDVLGIEVRGMWPAEGSVSPEAVEVFAAHGVRWIATDEDVLQRSLGAGWSRARDLYRSWNLRGLEQPAMFFRDHGLSDQLGFVYSKNDPQVAVNDLFGRIGAVAPLEGGRPPLVSIILDGENPWEHYPDDGKAFLELLYTRLSTSSTIETTYPSRYLESELRASGTLETLHSGSWILGNYQIWIGHEETNRGWELLGQARQRLLEKTSEQQLPTHDLQRAWEALHIAEGSDWFWWYGDDFSSDHDDEFDRLFRSQLRYIYSMLREEPPVDIEVPIGGRRKRADIAFSPPEDLISPKIDGKSAYFYEWSGAGLYRNTGAHGAMFENTRFLDAIWLGFDLEHLYVRLDTGPDFHVANPDLLLRLRVLTAAMSHIVELAPQGGGSGRLIRDIDEEASPIERVAYADSLEFALPLSALGVQAGEVLRLALTVCETAMELERHPSEGNLELIVPDATFKQRHWMV